MEKGQLLVVEGLDGSGKATQAAKLAAYLKSKGEMVEQITFPDYNSQSSALVKMYLAGEIGAAGEVNAYAASSFYAADRYISFHNYWQKLYTAGHTIVSDRYSTSNAAHQMSKLPKEEWDKYLAWLEDYEFQKLGLPRPDLVIYLDMHPDTSRELIRRRSEKEGRPMDIHENDLQYLLACREAALYASGKLGWKVICCCDGKEPFPVEAIFKKIVQTIGF